MSFKNLTSIIALFFLFSASANAWEINQNDVAVELASSNNKNLVGYNGNGIILYRLVNNCNIKDLTRVYDINNTPIKFDITCQNKNIEVSLASSLKGKEFLLTQFKNKQKVTVNNQEYSTVGFNSIAKELEVRLKRNESAL